MRVVGPGRRGSHTWQLIAHLARWTTVDDQAWAKATGRSLRPLAVGERVSFGRAEMILTMVVTTALARQANRLIRPAIPRERWADLLVADLVEQEPYILEAPDRPRRAGQEPLP